MKKNNNGKKLSLKVETLRNLSADDMKKVNGGMPSACWTYVVPSSGITTLFFKACR